MTLFRDEKEKKNQKPNRINSRVFVTGNDLIHKRDDLNLNSIGSDAPIQYASKIGKKLGQINRIHAIFMNVLFSVQKSGDAHIVELLINNGADVNHQSKPALITPLMIAAQSGWENVVNVLLRKNADVNMYDSMKWTALHHSVRFFIGKKSGTQFHLEAHSTDL